MNTGILITARLKSERLPRKVLRPLLDRPLLGHLVDRLKLSQFGKTIAICTSTVTQDDPLEEFAEAEGILCYRGHPDDVLERNLSAARQFGYDLVLSCTADNPFIDPVWLDKLAMAMIEGSYDFGTIVGLPFGCHSYSITSRAAEQACQIKDEVDTEVWGAYFTQTGLFDCLSLDVDDEAYVAPEFRLTVDELADFELMRSILSAFEGQKIPPLPKIIELLKANPSLAQTNAAVKQKVGKAIKIKPGIIL